jgi:ribosomal protein S18 acetylase RimI-like enzyme
LEHLRRRQRSLPVRQERGTNIEKLRLYRESDWAEFIRLEVETSLISLGPVSNEVQSRFAVQWPTRVRELYEWSDVGPVARASQIWVLEDQSLAYLGHLWLTEGLDFFTEEQTLFVTTVAVAGPARGRGYGRWLMNKALEVARERGIHQVDLGVEADNAPAIGLYESLGFTRTRLAMSVKV